MLSIKVKPGVEFHTETLTRTEFWQMPFTAQMTAPPGYQVTITSGCEGLHHKNSLHYKGWAVDLRTRDLKKNFHQRWKRMIQAKLGSRYLVLLEPTHIHIQFNG